MSGSALRATLDADRHRSIDERLTGPVVRRVMLAALLTVVLLPSAVSAAYATSSFYWYGENNSTCWQTGQLGSSSHACSNVGAGYLATPGHYAGGVLKYMVNGIENNKEKLEIPSGDYCLYANLGDNLTSQDSTNEGSKTGFTTPEPFSSYQEGDKTSGAPNVCQADGSHWGQELRASVSGNKCYEPTCLMSHYVSLGSQGRNDRPWSSGFVEPSLLISAEADPQTLEVKGTKNVGAAGYVCALLEEETTGRLIAPCLQEWRSKYNGVQWQEEHIGECGEDAGRVMDMVATMFWPGTKFATEQPGSANTYVWEGAGGHHFEAAITKTDFTHAIELDNTEHNESGPNKSNTGGCSTPGHPRGFSTNPEHYALIALEQDEEGWREISEIGQNTANLRVSTMFNGYKLPTASTSGASGVQGTQAALNGTVNPDGVDTHYYFQYGETTAYGSSTSPVDAGSGINSVPESATVTGLKPGTTYHYRIVATSAGGEVKGSDQTVTTPGNEMVNYIHGGLLTGCEENARGEALTCSNAGFWSPDSSPNVSVTAMSNGNEMVNYIHGGLLTGCEENARGEALICSNAGFWPPASSPNVSVTAMSNGNVMVNYINNSGLLAGCEENSSGEALTCSDAGFWSPSSSPNVRAVAEQ
jgi:Fibronectin type III domain